ncbi:hypothetical protein B0T16DRAFT_461819 [Cercophora newfieldiana]|uniref:Uncharacterized protein n=1 Tax=Cercophora newfieldiana TaxID=92897 RepID=A0AA39XWY4_9PEZI|nr:hypothetical protein B0T16DRAFT_461819 [Cercophora newfieldiana]
MRFTIAIPALLAALTSGVSAQGNGRTVIVQTFDSNTCNGMLGSAVVTENSCVSTQNRGNDPFPIGSFKILGSPLARDCRVVFHNDRTCSFRAGSFVTLEPNAQQMTLPGACFRASDFGVFKHDFLGIFCS